MPTTCCKPAAFYIPLDYDENVFKPGVRDEASYLLNLLHWKWISWESDDTGFIRLSNKLLEKVVSWRNLRSIKETLFSSRVIETDGEFSFRSKCLGYRLMPNFYKTRRVECQSHVVNRRIKKFMAGAEKKISSLQKDSREFLFVLKTSLEESNRVISMSRPKKDSEISVEDYRTLLREQFQRFLNNDHWYIRDRFGRIHTPLTSMPKELRRTVTVFGSKLVCLDLKNSQPLMAGIVACRYFASEDARKELRNKVFYEDAEDVYCYEALSKIKEGIKNLPDDVKEYIKICESGKFYESLMKNGEDRSSFKIKFYREVFFGNDKTGWPSALEKRFNAEYPSMKRMIDDLKKDNYRRFAWIMQNVEATIFVQRILDRWMTERPKNPFYTIHDSLLVLQADVDYARNLILDEFDKIGIRPTLEKESYA